MFTGLIEEIGQIESILKTGDGIIIKVKGDTVLEGIKPGDSIAINGACQTVTDFAAGSFSVFASRITCDLTNLGKLRGGDLVNLERAMTPESRFGGHFVQGHVDTKGIVTALQKEPMGMETVITVDDECIKYIVPRGSVAVDGVSLTVVSMDEKSFTLYLIPETLKNTIIPNWKKGDHVNIETDIMARYIERFMQTGKSEKKDDDGLKKKLMEEGFFY